MNKILRFGMLLLLPIILVACGEEDSEVENDVGDETVEDNDAATDFPSRQLRYIVPYGPGGSGDITARVIESIIREQDMIDEDFTVTNIDGASAGNGMNEVLDSDPDGHTLLHHHSSFIVHELTGVRDWGFEEFAPVAQLFDVPHVIFTNSDRYETMEEFLEDAENNPEELSVGTSSPGGFQHINTLMMLDELGLEDSVTVVTHGGGGDQNAAILGGENDIGVGSLPQHIDYHRSDDMQILAVASEERLDAIPDVPTFDEVGLDMDEYVVQTFGVWAHPETPSEVVDELYELFEESVEHEVFIEAGEDQGFTPTLGDGETLYNTFEEDRQDLAEFLEGVDIE